MDYEIKCPKCKKEIKYLSKFCGFCGLAFSELFYSKLTLYFEFKDEFEDLLAIEDTLNSKLTKAKLKFKKYAEQLKSELEGLSATKKEEAIPDRKIELVAEKGLKKTAINEESDTKVLKDYDIETQLGQKWLLITGVVAMLFGIGFFLKYTFDQGWFGPLGRVLLAYMWGIIFLIAGDQFRRRNYKIFGLYLAGGGIAVLYSAAYSAFQIYHLFGQTSSFMLMVLITILASSLAIVYNTKWLAVLALIGGFITPILLNSGESNQIMLMSYMTILNLGILGVAFYKKWGLLNILGFVFTYFLFISWYTNQYSELKFWPTIIFLNIFFLIYSVIPFAYQFFKENIKNLREIIIILINSFIAFGYNHFMIKQHYSVEWVGIVSVLYAIIPLCMALFLIKKIEKYEKPFIILVAQAAFFFIITIPIIFSREWITIFWAAQSLALFWTGAKLNKKELINYSYLLLIITTGKFVFYDYIWIFGLDVTNFCMFNSYTHIIIERYVTALFFLIVLFALAKMVKKQEFKYLMYKDYMDSTVFYTIWTVVLFIVLNIETSSFFYSYLNQGRFMAISVLWLVFSIVLMLKGFKINSPSIRKISLALFLFTILKVFLFDISKYDTPYRILSFIILGLVLVGASYLYHNFKKKLIPQPDSKIDGK